MGALEALRTAGAETIHRFALVKRDGRRVEADLPAPVLSLSRMRLDALAAAAAGRQGARFRFDTIVQSVDGSLRETFRVRSREEIWRPASSWEPGALQPAGRPAGTRLLPTGAVPRRIRQAARRRRLASRGRAVLHLFAGGYLGLSPVEGGAVNLAALATPAVTAAAHHDFDELLSRLRRESPWLDADLAGLAPGRGSVLVSEPVHLGPHGALAGDVLLAGDAAGVIDPYTGTGMALALLTGEAAAPPILEFLAGRLDAVGFGGRTPRRTAASSAPASSGAGFSVRSSTEASPLASSARAPRRSRGSPRG